ncbi:T9SS type A sorting domain-containing protein [candidate division WOR-3 bacterium]|nr:T9SS type A sorting domain-containing protein [candidate division WOR-3 bacterium]
MHKTDYDHVLGKALSNGRVQYRNIQWDVSGYLNSYNINLYGDPSLRHFGRTGIKEEYPVQAPVSLEVSGKNLISFSLPQASDVRIDVWDVTGRKVKTLINGHLEAGTQSFPLSTSGLPKGPYFISLRTNNISKTVKTIVLK